MYIFSVFKGMVMDGKDGKSYLADGHFAQLEGIKEESTLLLRNFYKSKYHHNPLLITILGL